MNKYSNILKVLIKFLFHNSSRRWAVSSRRSANQVHPVWREGARVLTGTTPLFRVYKTKVFHISFYKFRLLRPFSSVTRYPNPSLNEIAGFQGELFRHERRRPRYRRGFGKWRCKWIWWSVYGVCLLYIMTNCCADWLWLPVSYDDVVGSQWFELQNQTKTLKSKTKHLPITLIWSSLDPISQLLRQEEDDNDSDSNRAGQKHNSSQVGEARV